MTPEEKKHRQSVYRATHREQIRAKGREQYAKNPEVFKARAAARRAAHPDELRLWDRIRYAQDPEKYKRLAKAAKLRQRYALTLADREALFLAQNGRCKLCENVLAQDAHIDHKHDTHIIRGLLCRRCNLDVSVFDRRDGEWLARAYDYILADGKIT